MGREITQSEREASLGIEKMRHLQQLSHMDGWAVLMDLLQKAIEIRRDRLCALDCDHDETNRTRGEIQLIQWLRDVASIDDGKMKKAHDVLVRLQKEADLRHDLGGLHKKVPT